MDSIKIIQLHSQTTSITQKKKKFIQKDQKLIRLQNRQILKNQNISKPPLSQRYHIQNSCVQTLKKQNKQLGLNSENLFASYFNKFGSTQYSLQEINQKFVQIDCLNLNEESLNLEDPQNNQVSNKTIQIKYETLNSLVNKGKVKIEKLLFESVYYAENQHSISGKMTLKNLKNQIIHFRLVSGQTFGCSILNTSQHTVARGFQDFLEPEVQKIFNFQSFCGGSSLKRPHGDTNYTLTNFKLKDYDENMNQDAVWNTINK